jgi:hypothetical protein
MRKKCPLERKGGADYCFEEAILPIEIGGG